MIGNRIPRILLVDSEPKWSKRVQAILVEHGSYDVEAVSDIEVALSSSYADGFDLILVNAVLALGEGLPVFEKIVRGYPDKVLVISDVRSVSTAIKVFKMGADYAEKPFEPRRVIELVSSHLQLAQVAAD